MKLLSSTIWVRKLQTFKAGSSMDTNCLIWKVCPSVMICWIKTNHQKVPFCFANILATQNIWKLILFWKHTYGYHSSNETVRIYLAFWHERRRCSWWLFRRSTSVNKPLFSLFFSTSTSSTTSPLQPFLIEGVPRSKNLFCKSWHEHPITWK